MDSMSEENELNEGDLVVPTPADFSMFDMLDGVEYPDDVVEVALNEKAAFLLGRLSKEIDEYQYQEERDPKVIDGFRQRLDALTKQVEDSKMTFHLKGVPDEIISAAGEIADAKFEGLKKKVAGADGVIQSYLPQAEKLNYVRYMNAVIFSMHVTKFVRNKDGATRVTPTPDEIAAFMDKAPDAAKNKLAAAVTELRVKAADYEATFDEGFFQKS